VNKIVIIIPLLFFTIACKKEVKLDNQKTAIHTVLDNWHKAAATSNFEKYFSYLSDDAIFIGTDASENWKKKDFKKYCEPYFKDNNTWDFKPIQRHVYINNHIAWFDELLDTHMGICRGSGVLQQNNSVWKIKHYVLSIAIPNDDVDQVVLLKMKKDSIYINTLNPQ